MLAVDPVKRSAAAARFALVAFTPGRVAKVVAPGSLQNIAAECGHIADLGACREIKCLDHDRIVAPDIWMVGDGGHCRKGAQIENVGGSLDPANICINPVDVDEPLRLHYVELHQVEDRGAAGEKLRRGHCRWDVVPLTVTRLQRPGNVAGSPVVE